MRWTPAEMVALQRMAGNRAVSAAVQRTMAEGASAPAPEQAEQAEQGAAVIERLIRSVESHVVLPKVKANVWAPSTWWPEDWMMAGTARLKRTLERRVVRGELFNAQDVADIVTLSQANPQWLSKLGIGTFKEAEDYVGKSNYGDWLKLPPGKRLLVATLAYRNRKPDEPTPISPDYTLGRFMTTQDAGLSAEQKQPLYNERDEQIRQTAVNTLHPAGLAPEHRHPDADKPEVMTYAAKDRKAREIFTSVMLVLRHGLKIYDPQQKAHVDYREGDVIRALAHGGRVNIRIPTLRTGESPTSLTDFLGATDKGERAQFVDKRNYATHRTAIGKHTEDKRGTFEEKGGALTSLANVLTPPTPYIGPERPQIMGMDISGGGFGSKDWNGDVILPNGSWGHMLLVFTAPTANKDGSLLVGIETTKPNASSPVGYKHDFRSTEGTANPESVLHGHKQDKIGSGGLQRNERLVDLQELGTAEGSGDWRAFLDQIKHGWLTELEQAQEGSNERRAMYEQLVGPRQQFYGQSG
jgi:hypothetical protein